MEQRSWVRRIDEPMQFSVCATSSEFSWTGFEAKIFRTSGGFSRCAPTPYHCITMHLSEPIHATCRFDGKSVKRLQVAGDIDLLPLGTYAAWDDAGETTMLGIGLQPSLLAKVADEMGINIDRVSLTPRMQLRDPRIEHIGWAIKAELEAGLRFGRVYAESLGVALASHLLRRYTGPVATAADISTRRLRPVIDYIHDHLAQELSLFELADLAALSPTHFKAVFKRAFGLPVHQYIIRRRVEHAVRLISESELPLSDVAIAAGFSSQSHMARFMRRVVGISPAQLRSR